jgi:Domain of unknown function (DUF1996)
MRSFLVTVITILAVVAAIAVASALPGLVDGDSRGSFVVGCGWSHTAADDPIVAPFRPGVSHLHDFFGNVSTDAMSTREQMLGAATTCRDPHDTAAIWSPTAYLDGVRLVPLRERTYYFGRGRGDLATLPADLKMVAGNALAASPEDSRHVVWSCGGSTPNAPQPYDCEPYRGDGDTVDGVVAEVDFPQCWDGARTSFSRDAPSVAYLERGSCPSGFPTLIPRLRVRVHLGIWDPCLGRTPCTPEDTPPENLALTFASGPYFTFHADVWNTWDQPALDELVSRCLEHHDRCGGG